MFGSVESINNNMIKIVFDDGTSKEYLLKDHPHLKVGDVVLVNGNSIEVDENETYNRKKRIINLQRKLFKKRS